MRYILFIRKQAVLIIYLGSRLQYHTPGSGSIQLIIDRSELNQILNENLEKKINYFYLLIINEIFDHLSAKIDPQITSCF